MNKKVSQLLQTLKEDQDLNSQLKALSEKDPESFEENCLKFLDENGFDLSEDAQGSTELSLEELDQIAGGDLKEKLKNRIKELLF